MSNNGKLIKRILAVSDFISATIRGTVDKPNYIQENPCKKLLIKTKKKNV